MKIQNIAIGGKLKCCDVNNLQMKRSFFSSLFPFYVLNSMKWRLLRWGKKRLSSVETPSENSSLEKIAHFFLFMIHYSSMKWRQNVSDYAKRNANRSHFKRKRETFGILSHTASTLHALQRSLHHIYWSKQQHYHQWHYVITIKRWKKKKKKNQHAQQNWTLTWLFLFSPFFLFCFVLFLLVLEFLFFYCKKHTLFSLSQYDFSFARCWWEMLFG